VFFLFRLHTCSCFLQTWRKTRLVYTRLYKRLLNSPGAAELTSAELTTLRQLEDVMDVPVCVYFRALAAREVQAELGPKGGPVAFRQAKPGFFAGLFGGKGNANKHAVLSASDLKALNEFDIVAYKASLAAAHAHPPDYLRAHVTVQVYRRMSVVICIFQ
jgi:hypothetical protein